MKDRRVDGSCMNNGTTYGSRSNFSSGMFLSDQKDDMYDGIDTDYDGTPDEYLAIDENTPSITGVMGNLDDFNYEPIGGRSPVWTQLAHTGYSSHMVLTKHEYDIRQHLYGGILEQNVSTKIENADGQSVESSSNEKSHLNPADLDRTYSGVLGDGSGAIPTTMYDEHYIDPQLAGLWFMPILGDTNGAYEYKPSSYTNSPVGYYGVRSGSPVYNERWTWSHHERVNVGTGLIQAGTNGKGLVGIAPMFDWSDTINGLNTEASDSAYYKGMYADRGKGSISNSPTTESMARKFTANVTGGSVIAMLLDCISINVVRDNSTTGTNFFNFNPRNELGKEPEQYNDDFNNGVVNSLVDRKGPIVVSTYTNRNLSEGTSDWDDYLAGQSNYSLFGASFPKAVANNQYDQWENQVYPVRKTLDTGYNLDDYDLQRIVPAWDGVNTRINIDNAFPNFTDPPGSAQTVKVLTLNGLNPDTINDPLLYANVLTSNHADMSMYYGQYDVDSSDIPMNGINFGSDLSGTIPGFEHENHETYETPDATAVGWDIYNSQSSEFFNNYGNTNLIYGSSDRELVIRNSSINPRLYSGIDTEYRNFGPLAYLDAGELNTIESVSYNSQTSYDGDEINDGIWSGTNGWRLDPVFLWEYPTENYYGVDGGNRLEGTFSSSDVQVNLIGIYSKYEQEDWPYFNRPKLIRLTLINGNGQIVYTKNEMLHDYSEIDTDDPPDDFYDTMRAPQPTFINIPEGICAEKFAIEIWSIYERDPLNFSYPGIGEVEIYTGTNPDSKLINYTDTEYIPRTMETATIQNPIYSIDDGDSQFIEDSPDYYRSRPSQQGNFRVNIGVKSNSKNPAMRYNAYYTSAIDVTSNQSSYEYGNQPNPDPWDILFAAIWDNILFFALVIIVNILVLQWLSGGSSWAWWVGPAILAFDLAPIAIMAVEIVLYGEVGGFTKAPLYHMIGFYQLYNIIMDWDCAIVRFCFLDFEAPFKVIFDY